MIKVIRICDTCKNEFEQDVVNTPSRIDNVVVYPVYFLCNDCQIKVNRDLETSMQLLYPPRLRQFDEPGPNDWE